MIRKSYNILLFWPGIINLFTYTHCLYIYMRAPKILFGPTSKTNKHAYEHLK